MARTKFLAKVASRVAKPDGLLVVPPEGELDFLHPLPVELLWGVGPVTAAKLHEAGISLVGDVARLSERSLVSRVGLAAGHHLFALAHNRDPRPIVVGRRRRSIGSQRAIGRRPKTWEDIESALIGLVDRVTRRMRKAGRVGRTITLRMRFDDFSRSTRSTTLPQATAHTATILRAAQRLLIGELSRIETEGLTLVGVAISNLADDGALQLALPFDRQTTISLDEAVDGLRERYGISAVTRGVHLGKDLGLSVPILPD